MLHSLQGKLIYKELSFCLVENSGFVFKIFIPLSTYQNLPEPGETVNLFTYINISKTGVELYGFINEEDRDLFIELLKVPGLGVKGALHLFTLGNAEKVKEIIKNEDISLLTTIPGVGKKKAIRILAEFKGIVKEIKEEKKEEKKQAIKALVNLGMKRKEAERLVREVYEEGDKPEDILKKVLQKFKGK